MTFLEKLEESVRRSDSLLCVGLDPDPEKFPSHLRRKSDPALAFLRRIIEATSDLVAAYKPNFAFFGALGDRGWPVLKAVLEQIPPFIPVILDAKVGDIGNTAEQYARMFFDELGADALTVNPYMGRDAILPFLRREDREVFLLCLTSNEGAGDFEKQRLIAGRRLYERVACKAAEWNRSGNCGLVVGATWPEEIEGIRRIAPNLPFLIPGVGTQGGDLESAVRHGRDASGRGPLINVSRAVLYASQEEDFAQAARRAAARLREKINRLRSNSG